MTPDTKQGEGLGEATPRPWRIWQPGGKGSWRIGSDDPSRLMFGKINEDDFGHGRGEIDAVFLVEAVNNYDALTQRVKVLEEALKEAMAHCGDPERKYFCGSCEKGRKLLAREALGSERQEIPRH